MGRIGKGDQLGKKECVTQNMEAKGGVTREGISDFCSLVGMPNAHGGEETCDGPGGGHGGREECLVRDGCKGTGVSWLSEGRTEFDGCTVHAAVYRLRSFKPRY